MRVILLYITTSLGIVAAVSLAIWLRSCWGIAGRTARLLASEPQAHMIAKWIDAYDLRFDEKHFPYGDAGKSRPRIAVFFVVAAILWIPFTTLNTVARSEVEAGFHLGTLFLVVGYYELENHDEGL